MQRRKFVKQLGGAILSLQAIPAMAYANQPNYAYLEDSQSYTKLTILHTNDVHSRIDPFPMDGGRNEGKGGAANRAAMIQKIRAEEKNVLLFDAGDIFQGTPYFNMFGGELEMKLMSEMAYDASTIGNHDFDLGLNGLYKQLPHAKFPLLIANYDFKNTLMEGQTKPYQIFNKGKIKIGVFGIGIELKGLVPKKLYEETIYNDPISTANKVAQQLKEEEACDLVICLSHLGFKYKSKKVSDVVLAKSSKDIDIIIGGHTHSFMYTPYIVKNQNDEPVHVNQAGWGGILLGRMDVYMEKDKNYKCIGCGNEEIK